MSRKMSKRTSSTNKITCFFARKVNRQNIITDINQKSNINDHENSNDEILELNLNESFVSSFGRPADFEKALFQPDTFDIATIGDRGSNKISDNLKLKIMSSIILPSELFSYLLSSIRTKKS